MVKLISPYRIKFRNKFNTDYDLICGGSFDSDNGETESFFNKETVSSSIYDGSRRNVHNYHYTDVMTVSITLIKQDYTDLTAEENRRVISWLTGSNKVEELVIYKDDSDIVSYRLIGNVIGIDQYKLANDRVVGYVITFENISPYAYSPIKTVSISTIDKELTEDLGKIKINCYTDVYEKNLYPRITVKLGNSIYLPTEEDPTDVNFDMLDNTIYEYRYYVTNSDGVKELKKALYVKVDGGVRALSGVFASNMEEQKITSDEVGLYYLCNADKYIYKGVYTDTSYAWERLIKVGVGFEIKNTYFNNGVDTAVKSIIINCHENEIITLDGDNKIISSSDTPGVRVFGDTFNWEWIYFVPGENNITISGVCDVVIEWVEPIKIGHL